MREDPEWDWENDRPMPAPCTATPAEDRPSARDSNGALLADGDDVVLTRDLKVKGTSVTLKRGTVVRGIRLTADPAEFECRTDTVRGLVLRGEFVRKR